ncbi:UNVERIFIED_CONTAM: hypothetical protein FKN15_074265 [Acipenser sinensis]
MTTNHEVASVTLTGSAEKREIFRGAGGREAVASEPALTPEHALTTEHNTAQRTPHDPPRRRAQFRARRIVV